jgi:Nif11 domain
MSTDQARQLVKRVIDDDEFRERLDATPNEEKRALLAREGYGDVKLRHLSDALPQSSGGELSDEEFAAVAGGGKTTTLASVAGSAASGGVVSATVVVAIASAF